MRVKYVEEEYPRYFEFGKHPDGRVDIASSKNSTIATVSEKHAKQLIEDRDAVVQKLCDTTLAYYKLLHVARAADAMIEKDAIYLGEASDLVEKLVEALKEVKHLL